MQCDRTRRKLRKFLIPLNEYTLVCKQHLTIEYLLLFGFATRNWNSTLKVFSFIFIYYPLLHEFIKVLSVTTVCYNLRSCLILF